MFNETTEVISTALEDLKNMDLGIKLFSPTFALENLNTYLEDSNVTSGNEALSTLSVIKDSVETPSGDPKNNYGQVNPIIALHNRLNQIPYSPVSIVGQTENGGVVYRAKLCGAIEDTYDYLDLLECLSIMKQQDTIIIDIDSPGGYVHTGVLICTHILLCKGTVVTNAVGLCASAGSMIWSAGHICKVEPTALLMWHMSSHMDCGNSLAIESEAKLQVSFVKNVLLAASLAKGHITQEEIDKVCSDPNVTIYVTAEEMNNRINNHNQEGM